MRFRKILIVVVLVVLSIVMVILQNYRIERNIRQLKDEDWVVREVAVVALGKIGDVRAVEPLIQALKDEDEDVRGAAKNALNKIKGTDTF